MKAVQILLLMLFSASPAMAEFYASADQVRPLLPGMQAPVIEVLDVHGEPVVIDPETMQKPLVLTFYRGGWCPYCNMHLSELRKAEAALQAQGFQVVFVSADKPELLYDSLSVEDVSYQLYSDAPLQVAQAFGIAFKVDAETLAKYAQYGNDLSAASGQDHNALPVPATFIIGTDGRIHFSYANPDYSIRLSPAVLLAAAQAYQDNADQRLKRR
ncbi:MAG: peroxiredoxin-like family protein [Gammaproteobacteria bacterium]|jgi:peroxiredoxin|nr:peroxiredoxin-like family protein [Gammaproteobacteria bacterium]